MATTAAIARTMHPIIGSIAANTRDDVAARLFRLLPAIVIWIALIIAGFVLWEVFPVKPARLFCVCELLF